LSDIIQGTGVCISKTNKFIKKKKIVRSIWGPKYKALLSRNYGLLMQRNFFWKFL